MEYINKIQRAYIQFASSSLPVINYGKRSFAIRRWFTVMAIGIAGLSGLAAVQTYANEVHVTTVETFETGY
jgi:hypothetical protein